MIPKYMKISIAIMMLFGTLFFMFAKPVSSQEQSLGTFKQDSCISLIQTCDNCSYVNISIYYNSSTILLNKEMTKQDTIYNYTFCNTSLLGEYIYMTKGDPNGIVFTSPVNFFITTTGYQINSSQSSIMIIIASILALVAILMFIFGIKTDYIPLKLFLLSFTVVIMVFLIGFILSMANSTIGEFSGITSSLNPIYIISIALLAVGGTGLVIYLIYYSLQLFYKTRGFTD